jgi:hypothetical protein
MFLQENALLLLLLALILHAALACVDVLLNHELLAQLPRQQNAVLEQWLHSARELIFGLIFAALAWGLWHGMASWVIAALLLIEFVVTIIDTVVEVETRKLPVSERINHVFLYVNYGFICLLFGLVWIEWSASPSAIVYSYYGAITWVLTLAACGAIFFCMRDAIAAVKLGKQNRAHFP